VDGTDRAQRLAPAAILCMVAAAVALMVGAVLDLWLVLVLAAAVGLTGVGLLVAAALAEGRARPPPG